MPLYVFRNYPRDSGPVLIVDNEDFDWADGGRPIASIATAPDGGCTPEDDEYARALCAVANYILEKRT